MIKLLPPKNIDRELYQFLTRLAELTQNADNTKTKTVDNRDLQLTISKFIKSLNNVDNTSDIEKPISKITQNALDNKLNIDDVIDSLTSTDIDKTLSANQGKVLKDLIDGLTTRVEELESA